MPVEAKPLFGPEVLRPHLDAFSLPPVGQGKLGHWVNLTGRIDGFKETDILRDFMADFFVGLLGYTATGARPRPRLHHLGAAC